MNERPIDARTQSREDCVKYVSPNSLLLGHTGKGGDQGSFEFEGSTRTECCCGRMDVVWLADQNALRGQFKLARVVSVNADKKQ